MRVVVTGGGTGGHIFPALAVAELLRQQGHDILYIGKPGSMENELVPQRGFAFEGVVFSGMPRKPGLALIKWFAQLYQARLRATQLLKQFRPDVVFGTGGYVTGPVLMAAQSLKIPYAVHEPDAQPGLVNRLMARNASLVTAAFEASKSRFQLSTKAQFHATGNPIRQDLGKRSKAEALQAFAPDWDVQKPTLLVFGGSQGARSVNQAVIQTLPALLNDLNLQVIHLSGQKLFEESQALLKEKHPQLCDDNRYRLLPFSQEMPTLMAASDLALTRSGSLTLSETYMAGLPTVLIPYPFAAADHQTKNAQASVNAGASVILTDKDCSGEAIYTLLHGILQDGQLCAMQQAAKTLAKPNATPDIVALLTGLVR